jgi:predicted DNA-binding protein YlxM (UPF0122 family)
MRRIVSDNRYTYFIETRKDKIEYTIFETGSPMTVEEIGEKMNVSRMTISRCIKKAVNKIYNKIKQTNKNLSSYDIIYSMSLAFNLHTIDEYKNFLLLFPKEIRSKVNEEAKRAA